MMSLHYPLVNLVLSAFFFATAYAAVVVGFKSAECADDCRLTRPWWRVPLTGFIGLAFWLAGHGLAALDRFAGHVR